MLVELGETLGWFTQTYDGDDPTDADSGATFEIYGPDQTTPLLSGDLGSKITGKTGFYLTSSDITGGNGFESGKNYVIRVEYAISTVAKVWTQTFVVT